MNQSYYFMIIAATILLLVCSHEVKGELLMFIELKKTSYNLGESIPVEITYKNSTQKKIVMENPQKSFNIIMHVVDKKSQEDMNYSMGKIESTDIDKASGQYAIVLPPNEEIEIEPGSSLVFISDLNKRLYLRHGEFDCFLTDRDKESNHVEVIIKYSKESVVYLLEVARNEGQVYGRREWAMDWLHELSAEFKLKLSLEGDSDDIKVQNEAYNQVIYDEFVKWWNNIKGTTHVEDLLKQATEEMF